MSTLKTNNLEHLDAPSPNITLGIGGGVNISGITTTGQLRVGADNDGTNIYGNSQGIGIGIPTPTQELEVNGAIVARGQANTYSTDGLYLQNKGLGIFDISAWRDGASVSIITFSTDEGSDAAPVEQMRLTQTGNLGIGTNNPNATLHVEKDGTSQNLAKFEANTGTNTNRAITIVSPETDDPNAPFTFLTGNSFQFQCDTHIGIKIDDDGLVGIATTTPATALSVAGDVRVQNSSDATQYLTINYQGIDFQNTGAGSSTAATSHLLDDYEEGTFTPTITDCTSYSTQKGYYVKVGRLVHFTLRVQPTAGSGSASGLSIGGLPFTNTSIASGPYGGAFSVYGALVDRNSIPNLVWFISTNDNKIIARSETSQIATNNSAVSLTGNYLYVGSYYTA